MWAVFTISCFLKSGEHRRKHPCAESQSGDDVTVVTVHGRVSSRPNSRVLSVPVRILRAGVRVVVGGTSTVSGSRRIVPNINNEDEPLVIMVWIWLAGISHCSNLQSLRQVRAMVLFAPESTVGEWSVWSMLRHDSSWLLALLIDGPYRKGQLADISCIPSSDARPGTLCCRKFARLLDSERGAVVGQKINLSVQSLLDLILELLALLRSCCFGIAPWRRWAAASKLE